jgi:isopentenyl-diphosphate delta-isomerase
MVQVVLVDHEDKAIGLEDKTKAHTGDGVLHRAFTALVFNSKGEILVAQRSATKMLWPLVWGDTCASHPLQGEGQREAGERRLAEELGFTCELKVVDRFTYQEKYKDLGAEKEVCTTLIGTYDGEVDPVADEVADCKWMSIKKLKKDMSDNPDRYTIWFKLALDRLIDLNIISRDNGYDYKEQDFGE